MEIDIQVHVSIRILNLSIQTKFRLKLGVQIPACIVL